MGGRRRRGITLIELLVVIAIVGIMFGLLLPAVQKVREVARQAQCRSHMKEIGLAIANYEAVFGVFAPGGITYQDWPRDCSQTPREHGLFTFLLPFMENAPLYNAVNFAFGAGGPQGDQHAGAVNNTGLSARISSYICPSDGLFSPPTNKLLSPLNQTYNGYSQGSYAGSVGTYDIFRFWCGCAPARDPFVCLGSAELTPDGAFGKNHAFPRSEFPDGLSHTIFVGEFSRFPDDPDAALNVWSRVFRPASAIAGVTRPQVLATVVPRINAGMQDGGLTPDVDLPDNPTAPISWKYDKRTRAMGQFGFRSRHGGGANFLMGDGSVRFIKDSVHVEDVYWALGTRDGGEVVDSEEF